MFGVLISINNIADIVLCLSQLYMQATKLRGYKNLNMNLSLGNGIEFHNQYTSH